MTRRADVISGNPWFAGWRDAMRGACGPQVPAKTAMGSAMGAGMQRSRGGTWADPAISVGPPVRNPHNPSTELDAWVLYEYMRGNCWYFSVDSDDDIVAGDTVEVTSQPQEPCVPVQMTVDDNIAAIFGIVQITIGVKPVFVSASGTGSMAIFKSNATAPKFRAELLTPGKLFVPTVENISGGDERFLATTAAVAVA